MAARPRDSENRLQKKLQAVVVRAAVGRLFLLLSQHCMFVLPSSLEERATQKIIFLGIWVWRYVSTSNIEDVDLSGPLACMRYVGGYIWWVCQCRQANINKWNPLRWTQLGPQFNIPPSKYSGAWFACIGGYDADVPPTRMVLGKIQDQKQKYTLEWPTSKVPLALRLPYSWKFSR